MSSFDEKIARAKARPRSYKDVPVCLDADIAEQRDALLDELAAAEEADASDARLAAPTVKADAVRERLDTLAEAAEGSLDTLRFVQLPGTEWTSITALFPPRIESPIDMRYGYNVVASCGAAAGHRSDDGTAYAFRVVSGAGDDAELEPLAPTQIADLLLILSGAEISEINDAIWALNEYEPGRRIDQLVKGFGAATRSATN
jgi:hypothetical protein